MKLKIQTPQQALKAFPKRQVKIVDFKKNLIELLDKIKIINEEPKDESEEHLKTYVSNFLRDTFYKDSNEINTKYNTDLVIYKEKYANSNAEVLIETKIPKNKSEMISENDYNKKAFQQLVYYFLKERLIGNGKEKNLDVKHLIITNINEWFIFDAKDFEHYFAQNKKLEKDFLDFENKLKSVTNTKDFYKEIAKPVIDKIEKDFPCVYFNIQDYNEILRNEDLKDDKELVALYKILAPEYLLKIKPTNDSNTLNEGFYKELLHILGLEQYQEGSKKIIDRKKESRNAASLIETTIDALLTEDVLHRIPNQSVYESNKGEIVYNVALELCITWMNRILFLKLLEGQLISYNKADKENYRFMKIEMINDFDELFKLFHKVLGVNLNDRTEAIKAKYSNVPYLNSSLFEISELEDQTIKINSFDDNGELELFTGTILTDKKKEVKKLSTLQYLFLFLDAYDFGSTGKSEIKEDTRPIINASVLGLIFEKINGYKDGSFYTPGFITMYMCKETIRRAVTEKFNEKFSTSDEKKFDKFEDVRNFSNDKFKPEDILELNSVVNSLRICDPAVGSGHFLVSALNEIIQIKSELGILADEKGNKIKSLQLKIENDELNIEKEDILFEYKYENGKINNEIQLLQKTLFHEKQTIIENCLFGVDINPNSVKICRLRLWIELLKNAYYTEESKFKELETLPNIDINIKCGNSLIARFDLDADLSDVLKKNNTNVKEYRGKIATYRNAESKEQKREMEKFIKDLVNNFKTNIDNPFKQKLSIARGKVENIETEINIQKQWGEKSNKQLSKDLEKAKIEFNRLETEKGNIESNVIYQNAFEWRFEFPEVLNDKGEFVGFDAVIGNPPYVGIEGISFDQKKYYETKYITGSGRFDLYTLFIEKAEQIQQNKSAFSYIIPGKFLNNKQFVNARKLLCKEKNSVSIIKIDNKVFDDAQVDSVIVENYYDEKEIYHVSKFVDKNLSKISETTIKAILQDKEIIFRIEFNEGIDGLVAKIEQNTLKVKEIADVKDGIVAGRIKDLLFVGNKIDKDCYKLFFGKNINRYSLKETEIWVNYKPKEMMTQEMKRIENGGPGLRMRDEKIFKRKKIIYRKVGKELIATFDETGVYYEQTIHSCHIIDEKFSAKFVLGLFNSSLFKFYYHKTNSQGGDIFPQVRISSVENLPIKNVDEKKQKPISDLVDKILVIKKENPATDTTVLENQIDDLVYKLYDLTPEEIDIISESVLYKQPK